MTMTMMPRVEVCQECGSLGADRERRGLCGRCYSSFEVRIRYSSTGRRLADVPVPPARDDEPDAPRYHGPPPIVVMAEAVNGRPRRRSARLLADVGLQRADDADILAAVDRIAAEGRHRAEDGTPGASCSAVMRAAELPVNPATAAFERLLAAGALRRVEVRVSCAGGELAGRIAAGVQRVLDQVPGLESPACVPQQTVKLGKG